MWAAVGFASVCAYAAIMQIVSWPSVVHAFNTTRAALLLCALLFWGTLFLRYGPAQAVRSMWKRDVRWALNPRATLGNLWGCWRGSTITFSAIDVALAMAAVIYQRVDGTEAEAETGAGPEARDEAEAESPKQVRLQRRVRMQRPRSIRMRPETRRLRATRA